MHGMNIYKSTGSLVYSSADVTWNQVDFFLVAGDGSAVRDYPILSGREVLTAQIFINSPPTDQRALAHNIVVSGTTVTVSGGSEDTYILVLMR
jgi:hypothetical protein